MRRMLQREDDPVVQRLKEKHFHAISTDNNKWKVYLEDLFDKRFDCLWPPLMNKQSDISAVMVVKNESQTLRQAIASIAPHVKEIIAVDTGSTDGTAMLFRHPGIKIFKKEFTPWNFSAAKNFALSKVATPFAWVVDGDEEVTSVPPMFEPLDETTVYWISCEDVEMRTLARIPRIFPANLRYESEVHNELVVPPGYKDDAPHFLRMLHWQHFDGKKVKARSQRNEDFLLLYEEKVLRDFRDCFNGMKISMAQEDWVRLRKMFLDGRSVWDVLPKETRERYRDYLLFPCLAALSDEDFSLWTADEFREEFGPTVDGEFCVYQKRFRDGDLKGSLEAGDSYVRLCQTEPHMPGTSQATIKYLRDVEYQAAMLDYYLENDILL